MGLLRPTFATPYGLKKDVVASPQAYDMHVKGPCMGMFCKFKALGPEFWECSRT